MAPVPLSSLRDPSPPVRSLKTYHAHDSLTEVDTMVAPPVKEAAKETMKAVRFHGKGDLRYEDIPVQRVGKDQVKVCCEPPNQNHSVTKSAHRCVLLGSVSAAVISMSTWEALIFAQLPLIRSPAKLCL